MRNCFILALFLNFSLAICLVGAYAADLPPSVGEFVMLKSDRIVIRAEPDESSAATKLVHGGEIMAVAKVNRNWLLVALRADAPSISTLLIIKSSPEGEVWSTSNAARSAIASFNLGWVRSEEVVKAPVAADYFSNEIRSRANSFSYLSLTNCLIEEGKLDTAIEELSAAIRLAPNDAHLYFRRAMIYDLQSLDSDNNAVVQRALDDLDAAIRHFPRFSAAYLERAGILYEKGDYAKASADWVAGRKLDPDNVDILNELAWLRATSPDDNLRDGGEALELANRACKLSQSQDADCLETLAAAQAEQRDFRSAIQTQLKAIDLYKARGNSTDEALHRLAEYGRSKPLRDDVSD